MRRVAPWLLVYLAIAAVSAEVQSPARSADLLAGVLARVADRLEDYYARAQSIICEEVVRLQPLGSDLTPDGSHVRELVYELRVSWEASADGQKPAVPTVLRHLMTVDGRPPRPRDEPSCFDPKPVSPEPLEMLLRHRQAEYVFTWRGERREQGRPSVLIEAKLPQVKPPVVVWTGDCGTIDAPGRSRWSVWIDRGTGDVLRLDEQLFSQYDVPIPRVRRGRPNQPMSYTVDRADSSISYKPVTFTDPDETVLLPDSIISLQVIRNSGTPRLRTMQKFSRYRRFITGGRILEPSENR